MIEPKFISFSQWFDIWQDNLKEYPCEECAGIGYKNIVCPDCGGTSTIECKECGFEHNCEKCDSGYLDVQCKDCDGHGIVTFSKQYEMAKKQDKVKWQNYVRSVSSQLILK